MVGLLQPGADGLVERHNFDLVIARIDRSSLHLGLVELHVRARTHRGDLDLSLLGVADRAKLVKIGLVLSHLLHAARCQLAALASLASRATATLGRPYQRLLLPMHLEAARLVEVRLLLDLVPERAVVLLLVHAVLVLSVRLGEAFLAALSRLRADEATVLVQLVFSLLVSRHHLRSIHTGNLWWHVIAVMVLVDELPAAEAG